jgi:hypothetical protein
MIMGYMVYIASDMNDLGLPRKWRIPGYFQNPVQIIFPIIYMYIYIYSGNSGVISWYNSISWYILFLDTLMWWFSLKQCPVIGPPTPTPGLVQLQGQARATSSSFSFAMVLDQFWGIDAKITITMMNLIGWWQTCYKSTKQIRDFLG